MTETACFPAELTARPQWCLWRVEPGKHDRPTKIPYRPDGRKASSADPTTWSTYESVQDVLDRQPGVYGGVGYFFGDDDQFCGVDLDVCLDGDGDVHRWAAEIIDRFADTYRAHSVSGYGLHILCRASLPGRGRNFNVPEGPTDPSGKRAQIGIFDRRRFFALTGSLFRDSPLRLADHQQTIEWLLSRMQQRRHAGRRRCEGDLPGSEIINHARRAKNGAKFARLWEGDWENDYGSQSEADLALCCMLAFWCGPNPSRIDGLFRQSGLARDKWFEREDYRQRTIEVAIEQTTEFHNEGGSRLHSVGAPTSTVQVDRDLPEIRVGGRQLPEITGEALAALQASNDPSELFVRGGRMVAVVRDERQRHIIAEVSEAALRGRLARSAFYYKLTRDQKRIECAPTLEVVRDILALPPADWRFQSLEGLTEAPCLRPDGTILDRAGYDPATRLFFSPSPELKDLRVPTSPSKADVRVALELIDSAIGEFPFVDQTSRANAIGSMLTPIVRPAIDGPTPLGLYDAPEAGTGKSLLADVIALVAIGRPAETYSAPREPEEWRKKITTMLATGSSVVVIDNVSQRLDADALCMALTSRTVADRMMRTFDTLALPVRCTWIATGNNIQVGGDMPRRCYWVRLDAKTSRPFRRTGFRHPNLRKWLCENRGELIGALLTVARYWFHLGSPKPTAAPTMGSFESWCEVIGGILEAVGIEGFLANSDTLLEQADSDAVQWEVFLLELGVLFRKDSFRVNDVVEKLAVKDGFSAAEAKRLRDALPDFLAEAADRTDGFLQRRLGRCFSERADRRFGESQVRLERADEDRKAKVQRWRVVKA